MSVYALVEQGSVVKTMGLPKSYGNISGFNKLSNEALKGYGFYPYTFASAEINPLYQKLGGIEYTVGADAVSGTNAVVNLSAEELAAVKAREVADVVQGLTELTYDTDWIYTVDANLTNEQQTAYTSLRVDMTAVKGAANSYTSADLHELNQKISDCKECMCARFKDFSVKMTALQSKLTQMLAE